MTKRIFEMYLMERDQWLSEVLQLQHQRSVIYLFMFINSVISEIDKNVHSMHYGFTRKEVGGTLLVFKRGYFKVSNLKF